MSKYRGNIAFLFLTLWLACCCAYAFDLQGHRGTRGLMPENTLAAFERALQIGVTTLELDIGITADGVAVISHDPYLNPAITRDTQSTPPMAWLDAGADGKARGPLIKDLTLAQLQRYDVGRINPASAYAKGFATQQPVDGQRLPTLAALFKRVADLKADAVRFNIETKTNPTRPDDTANPDVFVNVLLKTIKDAGLQKRVTVQSFDWRTLQMVQRLAPEIDTVYLTFQSATSDTVADARWTAGFKRADYASLPAMVKALGGKVWSPNSGAITAALVKESQALGVPVIPWTVNEPAEMTKLLEWQVDGIITDYPNRLRELMMARGMVLPPAVP